jgi:hypothetical protein
VERNGERLLFYTHSEVSTGRGRLNWPEKLVPRAEGGLDPVYWEGVNDAFDAAVNAAPVDVTSDEGGSKLTRVREWTRKDSAYMITAAVDLHTAQAGGIAFGCKDAPAPFLLARIDCVAGPEGLVSIQRLRDNQIIQKREAKIARKGAYNLRVIVCGELIKLYVDETLILTQYTAGIKPGDVYVHARRGEARYQNLKYYAGKTKDDTDKALKSAKLPLGCPRVCLDTQSVQAPLNHSEVIIAWSVKSTSPSRFKSPTGLAFSK